MAHGDEELYVPAPYHYGSTSVDDWRMLRPESSGPIQDRWELVMWPVRALLLGGLWVTAYWWRGAVVVLVATLVTLYFIVA